MWLASLLSESSCLPPPFSFCLSLDIEPELCVVNVFVMCQNALVSFLNSVMLHLALGLIQGSCDFEGLVCESRHHCHPTQTHKQREPEREREGAREREPQREGDRVIERESWVCMTSMLTSVYILFINWRLQDIKKFCNVLHHAWMLQCLLWQYCWKLNEKQFLFFLPQM